MAKRKVKRKKISKKWIPAPLPASFMLTAILGFIVSARLAHRSVNRSGGDYWGAGAQLAQQTDRTPLAVSPGGRRQTVRLFPARPFRSGRR